eukprot:sb/3467096/
MNYQHGRRRVLSECDRTQSQAKFGKSLRMRINEMEQPTTIPLQSNTKRSVRRVVNFKRSHSVPSSGSRSNSTDTDDHLRQGFRNLTIKHLDTILNLEDFDVFIEPKDAKQGGGRTSHKSLRNKPGTVKFGGYKSRDEQRERCKQILYKGEYMTLNYAILAFFSIITFSIIFIACWDMMGGNEEVMFITVGIAFLGILTVIVVVKVKLRLARMSPGGGRSASCSVQTPPRPPTAATGDLYCPTIDVGKVGDDGDGDDDPTSQQCSTHNTVQWESTTSNTRESSTAATNTTPNTTSVIENITCRDEICKTNI